MIKIYPLEWLDTLIVQTLNPSNKNITSISEKDLSLLCEDVLKESKKVQAQIKNEVFAARKKRQIRLLVRKYYSSFIYLMDSVIENKKNEILKSPILSKIIEVVISNLEEQLSFIETRFSNFLSLEEHVPISYLIVCRKEILLGLEDLKNKKIANPKDNHTIEIVIAALSNSNLNKSQHKKITYREILYYKELLNQLDIVTDMQDHPLGIFSGIDELLIEMNFNYYPYISYLIDQIEERISSQESLMDKISELFRYYKEFSQLLPSGKIIFDPQRQNIKDVVENWFNQEIVYLEKKLELAPKTISGDLKQVNNAALLNNKIECDLSGDQIALILRATDEARVIRARSMNYFFKIIVPHLSTPFKKDLSYHSVRSKSYAPEERDKEITIQTLERIIKKIKSY